MKLATLGDRDCGRVPRSVSRRANVQRVLNGTWHPHIAFGYGVSMVSNRLGAD